MYKQAKNQTNNGEKFTEGGIIIEKDLRIYTLNTRSRCMTHQEY